MRRALLRLALTALMLGCIHPSSAEESEQVELGRRLFFDTQLSSDGAVSCASCHRPESAFADGLATSRGVKGRTGTRNAPSLLNVRQHKVFLWDGRRESLEGQLLDPFVNEAEHGLRGVDELMQLVARDTGYRERFKALFGNEGVSSRTLVSALSAYVLSLDPGASRFDRYRAGEHAALTQSERRGYDTFRTSAQCSSCHRLEGTAALTDDKFHSVGVGLPSGVELAQATARSTKTDVTQRVQLIAADARIAALGHFNVSGKLPDIGAYRTPSLRNVALTAPYMHDGSVKTLEEAIERELYYRSVERGRPLVLTAEEKADLAAFLRALTAESFEKGWKKQ